MQHHDVAYVANSRNVLRPMMRYLLPTDLDLAIYGADWEGLIAMKYVVAEHVTNDELRRIYSSAKVVLADHWDDMREHGFVSNRIYDALAYGAMVASNDVVGFARAVWRGGADVSNGHRAKSRDRWYASWIAASDRRGLLRAHRRTAQGDRGVSRDPQDRRRRSPQARQSQARPPVGCDEPHVRQHDVDTRGRARRDGECMARSPRGRASCTRSRAALDNVPAP